MGGRRIVIDSDDDDDFPSRLPPPSSKPDAPKGPKSTAVRRRKLGAVENDNALLLPWSVDNDKVKEGKARQTTKAERRPRQQVEVRTRRTRRVSELPADDAGEISTEEATVLEDVALGGDEASDAEEEDNDNEDDYDEDDDEDDSSEFHEIPGDDFSSDDSLGDFFPSPAMKKPISRPTRETNARKKSKEPSPRVSEEKQVAESPPDEPSSVFFSAEESFTDTLEKPMSQLSLDNPSKPSKPSKQSSKPARSSRTSRASTPPPSPPRTEPARGLVSPTMKLPRIPMTPHRPSTDAFWDQQLTNDWNQEHSPRKLLFQPAGEKTGTTGVSAAPPPKKASSTAAREREAKKMFQQGKHETAEKFLAELDKTITNGELGRLAATTGGVRIVWTNKLNTTAGRANWRRETLRPRQKKTVDVDSDTAACTDATDMAAVVRILHHASIELAEKVIDDEHRLLNVLAHEFCHLANFMVSGITGNPHGREFKAWAAQCSRHFESRGIQVTTKHTYEIDFRYVWTCEECATQFKRHSKSIDPTRHRCGACRGELRQTKPVPRGAGNSRAGAETKTGAAGSVAPKGPPAPSAYQMFMKENMAVLRRENPGSPQKMIMKLVAERWTRAKEEKQSAGATGAASDKTSTGTAATTAATRDVDAGVTRLHSAFVDLTLK